MFGIEKLFKRNAAETTAPNGAKRNIRRMHQQAVAEYENSAITVGPVIYKNKAGIFGLFKDETAHFSITHPHKPGSLHVLDQLIYDVSYSSVARTYSVEIKRHYLNDHDITIFQGRRSHMNTAETRQYLGIKPRALQPF